jgi:serine protease Do
MSPQALLLCAGFIIAAPQDTDLEKALALEKTAQKVITQCEPSIARILVSRSELYARFGQGPADDNPGKLGAFDAERLRAHPQFTELAEADRKAVLRKLDLAQPGLVPESSGSGAVVDNKGLVLTPYHTVYGAAKIFVQLPAGQSSYADILAADPRSDLAVLKLLRPKLSLKAIHFGDGGAIQRGQFLIGLANPFVQGLPANRPTAGWGMVSNLRQRQPVNSATEEKGKSIHHYGTLVQTEARLNLGASGGVLFNLKGDAVALTTTLDAAAGPDMAGTFAIPFDDGMRRIIDVLLKGEEVEYGFLGIGLDTGPGKGEGAVLKSVIEGSPAEQAGLKEGHVILAVDGEAVADNDGLLRALSTRLAGSKVRLDVQKPGIAARDKVEVVLARFLVTGKIIATERGKRPLFRGLRADWTSLLAQQPGFAAGAIPRGVLIGEVQTGSAAAKADLKAGQVITHVNDRTVATPAAFYEAVLNQKGPVELRLYTAEAGQPAPKVILP